jgi:recombination protein RecA
MNVIQKSGAFFRYGEDMLGQGKEATKMYLKENKGLANKIKEEILKANKTGGTPVEVGVEENDDEEEPRSSALS